LVTRPNRLLRPDFIRDCSGGGFGDFTRVKIQRALVSVSDKTGLVPLTRILAAAGIDLVKNDAAAHSPVVDNVAGDVVPC
jgi:hypothetical protein